MATTAADVSDRVCLGWSGYEHKTLPDNSQDQVQHKRHARTPHDEVVEEHEGDSGLRGSLWRHVLAGSDGHAQVCVLPTRVRNMQELCACC
jgi:hypothetical protein